MPSVRPDITGKNASGTAPAIRRVKGFQSLSDSHDHRPNPPGVTLPVVEHTGHEPSRLLNNESTSQVQPSNPQLQKRTYFSRRRSSADASTCLSRFKARHRSASESTSRPSISTPFDPVHKAESPQGADVKLTRYPAFVGRGEKSNLAPGKSLRSFASHKQAREQVLTAHHLGPENPNPTGSVPLLVLDPAPDVDQRVANAPQASLHRVNSGPYLHVSDSWQLGKQRKKIRRSTPPGLHSTHGSQVSLSLARHLGRLHVGDTAAESEAIERQTERVRAQAFAQHYAWLKQLEQVQPASQDGGVESLVLTEGENGVSDLDKGPPVIPENVLVRASSFSDTAAPTRETLQTEQPRAPQQDDHPAVELSDATFGGPLPADESSNPTISATAPILPEILGLGTSLGFGRPQPRRTSPPSLFRFEDGQISTEPAKFRDPIRDTSSGAPIEEVAKLFNWEWSSVPNLDLWDPREGGS